MLIFLVYGCGSTSLLVSKQELQQLKSSEGIIIGSIIVKNSENLEAVEESSFLEKAKRSFFKGEDYSYIFLINKANALFSTSMEIETELEKEKIFITKLEKGEYKISGIRPEFKKTFGWSTNPCSVLDIRFTVEPAQTTYLGKLVVIQSPEKMTPLNPDPRTCFVEDAQEETIGSLQDEYADFIEHVNKNLFIVHDVPLWKRMGIKVKF